VKKAEKDKKAIFCIKSLKKFSSAVDIVFNDSLPDIFIIEIKLQLKCDHLFSLIYPGQILIVFVKCFHLQHFLSYVG
jgi:hypothetical protein